MNAPNQAFGDQDAKRVVHRLERNRADLGPDGFGHGVGCDVGLTRYNPQDGQSLGGDLNAASTKEIGGIDCHAVMVSKTGVIQILELGYTAGIQLPGKIEAQGHRAFLGHAKFTFFLESALDEFGLLWIPLGFLLILASVAVLFLTI